MPLIKNLEDDLLHTFQRISPNTQMQYKQKRPYISSSMCPRQIMLNGVLPTRETTKTPALQYYGAIGNAIEAEVLKVYEASNSLLISGWKLPNELFPDGLDFGAKLDAIILHDGKPILLDIKTVGVVDSSAYAELSPEDVLELQSGNDIIITADNIKTTTLKKIKEVYEAQLQLYCAITGLNDGYIMTVSRRIQDGYTFGGHISAKFHKINIAEDILIKRMAVLLYGIMTRDLQKIPSPLAGLKKTHCKDAFCDYVSFCYENGQLDQNLNVSFPLLDREKEREMKLDCLSLAKEYISKRKERSNLTMDLIESEKIRRQHLSDLLQPIKQQAIETLKDFNIYPWDIEVGVKW